MNQTEAMRAYVRVAELASFTQAADNLGLPKAGVWKEVLNSDAGIYDGSDSHGNLGQVEAHEEQFNGFDAAAMIVVPPLGAVYFRYEG